jgi:type I restriction enzyme R subunit
LNVERLRHIVTEDPKMKEFIDSNPLLKKIKSGEGITSGELLALEEQIKKIRPEFGIDNIQTVQKLDVMVLLRDILGMSKDPDPQLLIEDEFDKYVTQKHQNFNSEQLKFLQVLKKVFARTKHLELKDFAAPPLSNERPLDKFQISELTEIVKDCNSIKMK